MISDSCYSGSLIRGIQNNKSVSFENDVLKKLYEKKSRLIITSGGNEPVLDQNSIDDPSQFLQHL